MGSGGVDVLQSDCITAICLSDGAAAQAPGCFGTLVVCSSQNVQFVSYCDKFRSTNYEPLFLHMIYHFGLFDN